MFRANLKKAVVMGLGMALLSSNIVFAQMNTDQEAEVKAEIAASESVIRTLMDTEELVVPDGSVSIANSGSGETSEAGGGTDGNAASDEAVPPVEEEILYTTMEGTAEDAAADSDLASRNEIADPDQSVSSDDELKIQITSTDATADAELLRKLAAESAPVKLDTDKKNVDTSLIVLAIAGGAAVIGGAVLASKKKNNK
ncbi:MAG: hypothetical protein GX757_05875 [Clostridiales bacterium]|nr:hypothetical protein [Clostridiales bacterium]